MKKKRNKNNYNEYQDDYIEKFSDKDFVNNSRYMDDVNTKRQKALDESLITTQSEVMRYQAFS